MKFGYMIDSPAYEPHFFEAKSIQEAVYLLEQKLPVKRMSQRDEVVPVEFWEDKGVERKDMTFEDVHSVYKLYPCRDGFLKCDELVESLWSAFPDTQQRYSSAEQWLGKHHTRGLVYLRHGEMGWKFGVDGLASIGSSVLDHLSDLSRTMDRSEAVSLYNDLGLSHADAVNAGLVPSQDTYITTRSDNESIPPELSGKAATGTEHWSLSVEDALARIYDQWSPKGDPSHYNLYLNGEKCILQFENGAVKAVPDLELDTELKNPDTQMALASIQNCISRNSLHPDKMYFYPVTTPDGPSLIDAADPEAGLNMTFVMKNCSENGIFDAVSALKAFNDLGDVPGKRLDICVFGKNFKPEQQINVLRQEGAELICGDMPSRFALGRNNHDICDILSRAFDKTLPLEHWTVRFITKGDHYGEKDNLVHTGNKPLVEFYDADYKDSFGPYGQFTGGRYYLETLQGKDGFSSGQGEHRCELSLDASIPKWTVSAADMNVVMDWLNVKEAQLLKERKPSLSDQMKSAGGRSGQQKSHSAPEQDKDR